MLTIEHLPIPHDLTTSMAYIVKVHPATDLPACEVSALLQEHLDQTFLGYIPGQGTEDFDEGITTCLNQWAMATIYPLQAMYPVALYEKGSDDYEEGFFTAYEWLKTNAHRYLILD